MKLVKRKNDKKYRVILDDGKEMSIYQLGLYDGDGHILGICDNHFYPEIVAEIELGGLVFDEPKAESICAFVGKTKNEFGRSQKILYLPATNKCKVNLVKSKMGDVANCYYDYKIRFYDVLVSLSDYYYALVDEKDASKAEEYGRALAKMSDNLSKQLEGAEVREVEISSFSKHRKQG